MYCLFKYFLFSTSVSVTTKTMWLTLGKFCTTGSCKLLLFLNNFFEPFSIKFSTYLAKIKVEEL